MKRPASLERTDVLEVLGLEPELGARDSIEDVETDRRGPNDLPFEEASRLSHVVGTEHEGVITPGRLMSDKDRQPILDIETSAVPYTVFSGFCMGSADVVPGVSGGTMAVALGVYHQLLAAITSADRTALKTLVRFDIKKLLEIVHWRFLVSLLTGVLLGVALMVKVVELPTMVVAESPHRPLVYAIFFGMVLASAIVVGRLIERWGPPRIGALVLGTVIGFAVVNLVPVDTPEHPAFIFMCGAIAICAMLLPGISGSFILLILGKYAYVLGALGKLDFLVILPFVLGCLVGLLSFSRFLKWLLDNWHDTVLASLIGLLIGSLWRIWPWQHLQEVVVRHKTRVIGATPFLPETVEPSLIVGFVAGIVFVVGVELYAARRRTLATPKPAASRGTTSESGDDDHEDHGDED